MQTYTLGDTLSNDGNALDLGELHQFHGGLEDGTRRGEVDNGINVAVLAHGLLYRLVNGQQSLAGSPVPASRQSCDCRKWDICLARTFCSRTDRRMCR
jgi:hypothetical protein